MILSLGLVTIPLMVISLVLSEIDLEPMLTPLSASGTADTYFLNNYFVHQALNNVLLCFLLSPFTFTM